jgi:hypothetical protein
MVLQFVNRRLIEPAGSLPAWTAYEAAARETMGVAPGPATTGSPGRARQMPIEWWDVVDGADAPVYQLWLCHMDCGTLFRAGTTDESGYVAQFHLHDFAGDGTALEAARAAAVAGQPDSMLASLHI